MMKCTTLNSLISLTNTALQYFHLSALLACQINQLLLASKVILRTMSYAIITQKYLEKVSHCPSFTTRPP